MYSLVDLLTILENEETMWAAPISIEFESETGGRFVKHWVIEGDERSLDIRYEPKWKLIKVITFH